MKVERVLLTMILAAAIAVIPTFLTSSVLAQTDTGTQATTDDGTTDGGTTGTTGTAADDESTLYKEFQDCLESAAGGETGFATEDEIRECFIDAGYTGGGDDSADDDENGDENEDENEDENDDTDN